MVWWGQGKGRSQEYVIHLRREDREVTMCSVLIMNDTVRRIQPAAQGL